MEVFYDESEYKELILKIANEVSSHFSLPDFFAIEVALMEATEIKQLNKEMRNVDSVTDVLSFPFFDEILESDLSEENFKSYFDPLTKKVLLGSIAICIQRMEQQAIEYGHDKVREMGYLFLHGMLHILGFDHIDEQDKIKMRETEELILSKLNVKR